jgi:ABC-type transport system substrate-binding protein
VKSSRVLKALVVLIALTAMVAMACGTTDPVEVIKEVPVEVEVIKEVPVETEVIREVEVIKEVPVIKEVVREVVKEVPVEVIKEVEVIVERVVVAQPTPTSSAPTTAATRYGTFRVAYGEFAARTVPPFASVAFSQSGQATDPMLIMVRNQSGAVERYIPGLIQDWSVDQGGTLLKINIAEGVEAHDGYGEWNAEDAVWLHDYYMADPVFLARPAWEQWEMRWSQTGTHTYDIFRANNEVVPVPDYLFTVSRQIQALSQDHIEAEGKDGYSDHPIGTGPFKFVKWGGGDTFEEYERVDGHWRADPAFDTLQFFQVSESFTRIAMLVTGQAEMTSKVQLDDAKEAEEAGHNIVPYGGAFHARIHFGGMENFPHRDYPWTDPKVRRAIAHSIDPDLMSQEIWGGFAIPLSTVWVTNSIELPRYGYDPELSKKLLAEAGYPNGFEVEVPMVTIRGAPRAPKEHNFLITFLENVGITVKGTTWDWYGGLSDSWTKGDIGRVILAFTITQFGTPQREMLWMSQGRRNLYADQWTWDQAAKMNDAYGRGDRGEYDRLEAELFQYVYDIVGVLPIYTAPELHTLNKDFSWMENGNPQSLRMERLQYNPS